MHSLAEGLDTISGVHVQGMVFTLLLVYWTSRNTTVALKMPRPFHFLRLLLAFVGLLWTFGDSSVQRLMNMY